MRETQADVPAAAADAKPPALHCTVISTALQIAIYNAIKVQSNKTKCTFCGGPQLSTFHFNCTSFPLLLLALILDSYIYTCTSSMPCCIDISNFIPLCYVIRSLQVTQIIISCNSSVAQVQTLIIFCKKPKCCPDRSQSLLYLVPQTRLLLSRHNVTEFPGSKCTVSLSFY